MHTLAYYVHNLNPVIFDLWIVKPRWYGMAYLLGFLGAYLLLRKLSRDGMLRLDPERLPDLVLNCCIFGVLIGGRLGYVFFYNLPISLSHHETPMLWDFSTTFPFWGVLRVWEGGMSAHGGIVFTILTLIIFVWNYNRPKKPARGLEVEQVRGSAKSADAPSAEKGVTEKPNLAPAKPSYAYKISLINIGDAACMVVPVGLFFGRIANFINGELYGHPSTVPWAVKFPTEIYAPTNGEMFPAVRDKLPDVMTHVLGQGDWFSGPGFEEGMRMLSTKLIQHQPDAVQAVAAILPPRHPSQLYEALLEGALLFTICWIIGRLWQKDGMASGAFLTLYPVMRIIGEQFRVGDTPAHILGMDISKGVLYSLPMVIIGAVYWGYWIKKDRRVPWVPLTRAPSLGGAIRKKGLQTLDSLGALP